MKDWHDRIKPLVEDLERQLKKPPLKPDIHFRVSSAHYKYLQAMAKEMDRSVSYLIEKIVKEWVETHAQEPK